MITDDAVKQTLYQSILKTVQRRLEQTVPGSSQDTFAHLSLASLLNLLFLLKGEWGCDSRLRNNTAHPSSTCR